MVPRRRIDARCPVGCRSVRQSLRRRGHGRDCLAQAHAPCDLLVALVRPRVSAWSWPGVRGPILLGIVSGLMTLFFLAAISRLPLGTAIAIDFLGPLTVAVLASRSKGAFVWPVLAFAGVLILTQPWEPTVDLVGVGFAALAGTMWGLYIVLMQLVGDRFPVSTDSP